jgi:hypothetical protein
MGRLEIHKTFLSENLQTRDHSEDLVVDERIILEWILGNYDGKVWTGCIWLRIWTSGRGAVVNTVMNLPVP